MSRLFVSVRPPPGVTADLEELRGPDEPGIRWINASQMHVTLRFLGEAVDDDVLSALAGVELPAAEAELGPRVVRLGRHVVVVPVSGLDPLAAAVRSATRQLGEPPDARGFRAHLTLARLKNRGSCRAVGEPVSSRWSVGQIELVSSVTDPDGAVHEVVARFGLAGGRGSSRNA